MSVNESMIVVALIAGVATGAPATIAAIAAWKNSHRAWRQVESTNGVTTAAMVESIQKDVRGIKADMQYHVTVQHGRGPIGS